MQIWDYGLAEVSEGAEAGYSVRMFQAAGDTARSNRSKASGRLEGGNQPQKDKIGKDDFRLVMD